MNQGLAKILVVDDEKISRDVIVNILQQGGYAVETTEDGEQAFLKLQEGLNTFSVIVLDFIMPNMDGLTFLKKIKADPDHAYIPVIMLTTVDSYDKTSNVVATGVYDFLKKPVDKNVLLELVGKAIADHHILGV